MLHKSAAATACFWLANMALAASLGVPPQDGGFADSIGSKATLKVMALGASITFGYQSTDGNGYRKTLRDLIVNQGGVDTSRVDFVGSLRHGDMKDNDVEGFVGDRIDQVIVKARSDVPKYKPNVVLINVGTNDALQSFYVDTVKDRMASLLGLLWANMEPGPILLSTLLINGDQNAEKNVIAINEMYRALVTEQQAAGKPIVLVETYNVTGLGKDDLVDGTHPTDDGYKRMGELFWDGMQQAAEKGFFGAIKTTVETTTKATSPTPTLQGVSTEEPKATDESKGADEPPQQTPFDKESSGSRKTSPFRLLKKKNTSRT